MTYPIPGRIRTEGTIAQSPLVVSADTATEVETQSHLEIIQGDLVQSRSMVIDVRQAKQDVEVLLASFRAEGGVLQNLVTVNEQQPPADALSAAVGQLSAGLIDLAEQRFGTRVRVDVRSAEEGTMLTVLYPAGAFPVEVAAEFGKTLTDYFVGELAEPLWGLLFVDVRPT